MGRQQVRRARGDRRGGSTRGRWGGRRSRSTRPTTPATRRRPRALHRLAPPGPADQGGLQLQSEPPSPPSSRTCSSRAYPSAPNSRPSAAKDGMSCEGIHQTESAWDRQARVVRGQAVHSRLGDRDTRDQGRIDRRGEAGHDPRQRRSVHRDALPPPGAKKPRKRCCARDQRWGELAHPGLPCRALVPTTVGARDRFEAWRTDGCARIEKQRAATGLPLDGARTEAG